MSREVSKLELTKINRRTGQLSDQAGISTLYPTAFFKWIKQILRIKRFYGTSENAVKSQIWIAIAVYALVAIIKKELGLKAPLHTLLQILSVSLFEKLSLQ